ncbi:MAG: PhnD/SsuA/transferrin family substrate-binding protein [Desulfuromonadaceae bacterium]|nr:PhnD/SsuA/transferrin family substrate-binding protein [Desulfuromonadaceae bacterium]MDD2855404.1 PhnD/SsuA/transferrin family substrate-binding protein [Desulfuromonadaceae bacterium]
MKRNNNKFIQLPVFIYRTVLFSLLICSIFPETNAGAAEPVRIGVLSFRPKPQTLKQWQPLAGALKEALPERDFIVTALTYPELNLAVANRQLDFVFTNPGHFVLLKMSGGLSAPLATLSVDVNGHSSSMFGGVIFTRSDRDKINELIDLKGKKIAAPDTESLGGFQMQSFELYNSKVYIPEDVEMIITGMPHDNVIKAVLDGRADVGFIRSGVLEAASREGRVDINRIKILNLQKQSILEQKVSTRLYPEWPFSALINTDESLSRHVAAALFTLEDNSPFFRTMKIHGFSVPADYTPVELMLRELRFPPFDSAPSFTIEDVWDRYRNATIAAFTALVLILLLSIRLLLTKRKLEVEKQTVLLQTAKLQESELRLRTILETEPECVKIVNAEGLLVYMNPAGLEMIEADSLDQVTGHQVLDMISPEHRDLYAALHRAVLAGESMKLEFDICGLKGGRCTMETHSVPMSDNGRPVHLAVSRNITERRKAEMEREAAVAEIKKLEGIIPICMYCKKIRDDQNSWNQLEQYITEHSEAMFSHGICPHCYEENIKKIRE